MAQSITGFIYLDGNDQEAESKIKHLDPATRKLTASTGLSAVSHIIAATPTGTAIHASLSVAAGEAASEPGTYVSIFQGADLTTNLASYVHRTVYIATVKGTTIHAVVPVIVKPYREAA